MTTIVPITMRESTLKQVDHLQERVHAPSRSDMVRRAVEVSDFLVNAAEKGETIIIESKNGNQRKLSIIGLNQ